MTLGMNCVCRGLGFIITKGYSVYGLPPGINILGRLIEELKENSNVIF
jgi:ribose/xylose/arabinose/galactoside ABC-type transport system permease subunit